MKTLTGFASFCALSLFAAACDSGPEAPDGFEDVVVTVDACGDNTANRPAAPPPLERDPVFEAEPAPVGQTELDPDLPEAAPTFCSTEEAAAAVCSCEGPGCVAEAIAKSFGCDVCVTFECGDVDRHDCVACGDQSRRLSGNSSP